MKTQLMHVRINVSNINEALEWYKNVLGFEAEDWGWPPENPKYFSFKSKAGADFSILEEEKCSNGRTNFTVDDVDELWEKLKNKVEVVEPLFNTPWGTRKFTIKDLDGNELGFVQGN